MMHSDAEAEHPGAPELASNIVPEYLAATKLFNLRGLWFGFGFS